MNEQHVVFVGAGASRASGFALNKEVLPEILRRAADCAFKSPMLDTPAACKSLQAVVRAALPNVNASAAGLPDITNVLSVLDYCIVQGETLATGVDLPTGRELLDYAIAEVLEKPIHSKGVLGADVFAKWLLDDGATLISTNYDVSLDVELLQRGLGNIQEHYAEVDFGFTWRDPDDGALVPPPLQPRLALYKLHGSLNWLKCRRCAHIYVNFYGSIAHWSGQKQKSFSTCECGDTPLNTILVTPSFVRTVRDPNLLSTWQCALERLRRASKWTFVGYSLPKEDFAIRALLLRAYHARGKKPPVVTVVDPSSSALENFATLFPGCVQKMQGLTEYLG